MKKNPKETICDLCQEEKYCKPFYEGNNVQMLCKQCWKKRKLKRDYSFKIEQDSMRMGRAVMELIKKEYGKKDILYILGIEEQRFNQVIKRVKNLVQYKGLEKKLSE